jgi:AraC-like DNA-binding protein
MLATAAQPPRIYQVAERCGFVSETHFRRAFRQAYGYTSREAIGRTTPPARPHGAAHASRTDAVFIDWISRLRR